MNELHSGIYLPTKQGIWTFLRPLGPADRPFLEQSLQYLSPQTLLWRFASPVKTLSDAEWKQLLNIDQENHVAWGILPLESDSLAASGVGRFARYADEPDAAEFALTITDASQGQGLGTILMALLIWLARQKEIAKLRGLIEADNVRMVDWMRRLGAKFSDIENGQMTAELDMIKLQIPSDSHIRTLLDRLDQLNVGPPEDRVVNHPHTTVLRKD